MEGEILQEDALRSSIQFGRLFGISIGAHYSWFLIFILALWSLAEGYFPQEYPAWGRGAAWIAAAVTTVLFFGSVLVHELGHSLVALRNAVPVSSITLFIFGGLAQLKREPPTPGAEFRIAIAGPLASLGLAALFFGLGRLPLGETVQATGTYLSRINLILAVFNMIPGFPLDGGRVLRSILWKAAGSYRKATRWASLTGQGVAFLFILWGVSMLFSGNFLNGVWIAFIGWFLNNAAESSYRHVRLKEMLSSVQAGEVMSDGCPQVPPILTLDRLVQEYILNSGRRCFFVSSGSGLLGMITLHQVKEIPREHWHEVTVGQAMTPASNLLSTPPDQNLWAVLQKMDETDVNQVPVIEAGNLLGVISRDHLLRYIRLRNELEV